MDTRKLIKEGEGQTIEFKANSENIGKDICAFANTNSGTILIGVDDRGNVTGIKNIKKTEEEIAIDYLKSNASVKSMNIQKEFDVTRDTANRDLNELIKLGLIGRDGTGKSTRYRLK